MTEIITYPYKWMVKIVKRSAQQTNFLKLKWRFHTSAPGWNFNSCKLNLSFQAWYDTIEFLCVFRPFFHEDSIKIVDPVQPR